MQADGCSVGLNRDPKLLLCVIGDPAHNSVAVDMASVHPTAPNRGEKAKAKHGKS